MTLALYRIDGVQAEIHHGVHDLIGLAFDDVMTIRQVDIQLNLLGHREPRQRLKKCPKMKYTNISGFRQLNPELALELSDFLNGKNRDFLRVAIDSLLEKTSARGEAEKVQEAVRSLVVFFREEANRLKKAKKKSGFESEFLSQKERDRTFILARFAE